MDQARPCLRTGRLSRRQLLQAGGLGLAGLGLPQLLQADAGAAARPRRREKSCIFIFLYGGASHLDTFDLKPDAPDAIRGQYRPIATPVPGTQVGELLPRLARLADRYCLIRSMTHSSPLHPVAQHISLSGQSNPGDDAPYFGSILAKLRPTPDQVMPYVWLQRLAGQQTPHYTRGGFLGTLYSPLLVGTHQDNPAMPGFRVKTFDPPAQLTPQRLEDRRRLLAKLDGAAASTAEASLERFRDRAFDMLTGPEARRAFAIDQEPAAARDRYGRHPLGQNLLLARRLVEAGVRLVTVTAWAGLPPGEPYGNSVETWDMHGCRGASVGVSIYGKTQFGMGFALPRLDESVSALLGDLRERGRLDDTLVVMVGEFGRSPKINRGPGRDHWPHCYTALLAGAGIRGGAVYGASDKQGGHVKDHPVAPETFGATLFHALGVPPETRLGADGFTRPASPGQPLLDLFG